MPPGETLKLVGQLRVVRHKALMRNSVSLVIVDQATKEELLIFGPYRLMPGDELVLEGALVEVPCKLSGWTERVTDKPAIVKGTVTQ